MKRVPDSNGFYWLAERGERPVVVEVLNGHIRWTSGRRQDYLRDDDVIESSPMFVPNGIRQADRKSIGDAMGAKDTTPKEFSL